MAKYLGEAGLRELITKLKALSWEILVVNTLPSTGEERVLYLVPSTETETNNIYAEYIWVNSAWEKLGEKQIEVDLSNYYTKALVDDFVNGLLSHEIDEYEFGASSPLNLTGSYSNNTLTITGSIDAATSTQDGFMSSSDKSKLDSLDTSKVVQSASASGTSPLTLSASISDGALSITGSVDAYSKSEIDSTVADLEAEISELSGGAVSTVNASGTSPLTLSASKSGTTVNITGSVDLSDYTTSSQLKEELSTYATKDDVDAVETEVATKQDKLTAGDNVNISSSNVISVDIPATPSLSELGGVGTINASGTSPLTLSASKSDTTVTISGSVDLSNYLDKTTDPYVTSISKYTPDLPTGAVSVVMDIQSEGSSGYSGVAYEIGGYVDLSSYAKSSDIPTLSDLGGIDTITASGTSPLTLSASKSGTSVTISGNVDLSDYVTSDSFNTATESLEDKISAKQDVLEAGSNITISGNTISATDTTYSNATTSSAGLMSASDKSTLDSLSSGAITEVTVSGSSPLTLQVTTSGNQLNITGSISASSASANGYMSSTQYTQLANLVDDPLQYADEITASDVDSIWDSI